MLMIEQLLNKVKKQIKILTGKTSIIRKEVDVKHEWYGNDYGGFYVHSDTLGEKSIIYSFGIGEDISFDQAIIEKHRCLVFGFDPTPKSIGWVNSQQISPNFNFYSFGIDAKSGFVDFNLPSNPNYVSGSVIRHNNVNESNTVRVQMKSITDIASQLGHKHIDILKMDIEGSEYEVLDSILSSPIEINQILLELHERFFADGKLRTKNLLKSLSDNGYLLFAVSDSFEELSFIKMR